MTHEDARSANELLACALDSGLRPGARDRYRALLDRYRVDPAFSELVESLLEPLGLRVLAADPLHGLVLDAGEGSPFAPTLDGLRASLLKRSSTTEERLLYGLILAAIAAWCYAHPSEFEEPRLRHVRATEVERKLRDLCEHLQDTSRARPDGAEMLDPVWSLYAARKGHKVTAKGEITRDCTLGMIRHALLWLVDQHFLLKDATDTDLFRATDRFRYHVRASASRTAYRLVAEAFAEVVVKGDA